MTLTLRCLHGSKSGDIVSSEMECWDGAHNGHGKMRSTEVIALSVSLILAVIILMSIFTACVLQVGQNRYKKVERELTLTPDKGQMRIEIKESLDTVQIDHELEGEFQTTEFRQNLDLDIEPTQDEVHQHAEPSHEMNYPMDEADFCHVIPGQSNDEEDIECDNFRFDWRDVAFNTRPLRLPRIAMADESND